MSMLAFINNIGPFEWVVILVVMLLLFGRRLPEVGKSLGKGIVEFKKGLKGVEDEIDTQSKKPDSTNPYQQNWQQQPPANLPPASPAAPVPGQPGTVSRADVAQS